jgi:hypothetical protein
MTGLAQFWLWLFPLTYAVHIAEEGLAGERFYRWISRVPLVSALKIRVGAARFFALNAAFLAAMVAAVLVAARPQFAWVTPCLGAVVAVNGLGHLVGSLATRSYSPGLISGLALWAPLGLFALVASQGALAPTTFWTGVAAGFLVYAVLAAILVLLRLLERGPSPS